MSELKAEFVNPFLRSTNDIVTTMLGGTLARGEAMISDGSKEDGHLMAVIGFNGAIKGTAAITLAGATAAAMVDVVVRSIPGGVAFEFGRSPIGQ